MRLSEFNDKLNKVGSTVYNIEEEIKMPETGVYENELQHDNINDDSLEVYTGPNLTGDPIGYTISTPSDADWKRIIRIETTEPYVYITYETIGDQVEGDDVNKLQEAIIRTQNAVTDLEAEVTGSINGYTWNRLMGISSEDILKITTQPVSASVSAGEEVSFTIVAVGQGIAYKWQYTEEGDSTWQNFTAGTASTLTVTPAESWDGRRIRCVLENSSGTTAISNTVTLTVT